jgi:hypothetical protein
MPGDSIEITDAVRRNAEILFPALLEKIRDLFAKNGPRKIVIGVCGGSGSGKSCIGSLLAYYFHCAGIGSYTLSGDNYPHRFPLLNDAERLRIFRDSGLKGMLQDNVYSAEHFAYVQELQNRFVDADPAYAAQQPWFSSYVRAGREGLAQYLGTPAEHDFAALDEVLAQFKSGESKLWLKRLGTTDTEMWYEEKSFTDISVLLLEWTHSNSAWLHGVDLPIFLNSLPEETLAYRKARNRNANTDTPLIAMVLEIEQKLLASQACKAKLIQARSGKLLSYAEYKKLMGGSSNG